MQNCTSHIERLSDSNFEMTIHEPIEYKKYVNYEKGSYDLT